MHLVSGKGGDVSPFPYAVGDNYMGQLWGPDCAEFRRIMHVFAPPGKLDQLVIINDGPGYLLVNTADRIEKLKQTGAISEQCAVVFVGTLPGLEKDHELTSELSKMQSMGIRTIDYLNHVDEYVEFLTQQLLPYLADNGLEIPHDSTKVTIIGSSMSGTASLYMGLRYPEHFGNVIAQSPSPANRQLIESLDHLSDRARRVNIDLSCGAFEDATQYAKIGNLEFMRSLETPLAVKGHAGLHGHELHAWSPDLERSLPVLYNLSQIQDSNWGPLLENNSGRSRVLSRSQAFVDVAEKHNQLPHLKSLAQQTLIALQILWPDAKPLAYYPAFTPTPSNKQQATVQRTNSNAPIDYPRAMQNNMMTPPASAMHRTHGSTVIPVTHHTLREAIDILPKNTNNLLT